MATSDGIDFAAASGLLAETSCAELSLEMSGAGDGHAAEANNHQVRRQSVAKAMTPYRSYRQWCRSMGIEPARRGTWNQVLSTIQFD